MPGESRLLFRTQEKRLEKTSLLMMVMDGGNIMLKYREFLDLTDEEIEFIIKEIFPYTRCVNNIERDKESNQISCDIYIMEEYPEFGDTLDLSLNGIDTHDFVLTSKELLKWRQFLLAKGCDYRLKDNPYME